MNQPKMAQQIVFETAAESAEMASKWIVYDLGVDATESLIRDHLLLWRYLHAAQVRLNDDRLKRQNFCKTQEKREKFAF